MFLLHLVWIAIGLFPPTEATLDWKAERPLTWSDFQGTVPEHTEFAAHTTTEIGMDAKYMGTLVQIKGTYDVYARFIKTESWAQPGERNRTASILKHEQLHFDITELHARKLRADLDRLRTGDRSLKQKVQDVFQNRNAEASAMQRSYDSQTDHGLRTEMQKAWEKAISDSLQVWQSFAKP